MSPEPTGVHGLLKQRKLFTHKYNKEGNLYRVCDHTGREVQLHYSYRVLQKYINSAGQVYNYGYNENLRLESITTPRNILAVKNIYDSANRVLKQITPKCHMTRKENCLQLV
ncbi:hypothetical protein C804_06260 [Lachnospiraceae bacterium A4]|nr:hypothetical protein C804_06260 [Lachnospiraceae bacterium A4]